MRLISYLKIMTVTFVLGFPYITDATFLTNPQPVFVQPYIDNEKIEVDKLTQVVVDNYDVDYDLARQVVTTAKKYEQEDFPKAADILSIISIESRFDVNARHSTQLGLTQIDFVVWRKHINKHELLTIDGSIKHCVNILEAYYQQVGTESGAIMAYNVGITAYKNGSRPKSYYNKYLQKTRLYEDSI